MKYNHPTIFISLLVITILLLTHNTLSLLPPPIPPPNPLAPINGAITAPLAATSTAFVTGPSRALLGSQGIFLPLQHHQQRHFNIMNLQPNTHNHVTSTGLHTANINDNEIHNQASLLINNNVNNVDEKPIHASTNSSSTSLIHHDQHVAHTEITHNIDTNVHTNTNQPNQQNQPNQLNTVTTFFIPNQTPQFVTTFPVPIHPNQFQTQQFQRQQFQQLNTFSTLQFTPPIQSQFNPILNNGIIPQIPPQITSPIQPQINPIPPLINSIIPPQIQPQLQPPIPLFQPQIQPQQLQPQIQNTDGGNIQHEIIEAVQHL